MDLFLKYSSKSLTSLTYCFCESFKKLEILENIVYIEKLKHLDYIELITDTKIQLAIGDVIKHGNKNNFSEYKGLFYLLEYFENENKLRIKSDEHGLLPLYYLEQVDYFFISSSFSALIPWMIKKTKNSDFYTQQALLYTQLNGSTYYNEIKRLEYGEVIEIGSSVSIKREKHFYDYFVETPIPFKKSVNIIAEKFIEISKYYLQEPCAISLTGGFDGRTITGCAKFHNATFTNFSYGRKGNGDVDNPILISKKLGLSYTLIELEDEYLQFEYLQSVREYIKLSGGLNGFKYPQSNYYPRKLKESNIVTGYLGSEILANAKGSDDELYSEFVIEMLQFGFIKENNIQNSTIKLKNLNLIDKKDDINRVINQLSLYFENLPTHLTNNQKLAVFSFENIHRNTFGPWIYNAMHFSKVRVPFLDNDFFNLISGTKVSQFYRPFLENNPMKRVLGQLLYARILKKVCPELNSINSSKGYPPKDILTLIGRFKIAYNRLLKRNEYSETHGLDKMSTMSGAKMYINNLEITNFDKNNFLDLMNESSISRSNCFLSLTKIEANCLFNKLQ